MHKKFCLSLELVGEIERSRKDNFDANNRKSQIKWKFDFPKTKEPGLKSMKTWNWFKKWIVNNDHYASYDFK